MANIKKSDLLKEHIEHIDITKFDARPLVDAYSKMAYSARDLARASDIYDRMLADKDCDVILCLAGSLFSAGLKKIVWQMVESNMVDAIVSTGANIVDQDFFEALGFKHYKGSKWVDDKALRGARVDRIYDTFIDEDELGECDNTISEIMGTLKPRPYSSREILEEMGKFLVKKAKVKDSIVLSAFKKGVPIFVPAFSDCSAGFGLLHHQWHNPDSHASVDSAKDFRELVRLKLDSKDTGLLMIGGGVPKNFAQDVTVGAEMLGFEPKMHKYAIQITVADERDGALSGSTLREACSWGKVDTTDEQMVFSEATIALPTLASYGYHKGNWKKRRERRYNALLNSTAAVATALR
ncbi:MAG TPA: deoxyhypusine synthase [Elusimicrobiota bacterium]|jgi:deoxyhypusine synthase|nr:deoxyhypusine synthase [Elusimicrobiota bacterium]